MDKKLVFIISNQELYKDLLLDNKREGLGPSINGLYQYLYDFIRRANIEVVSDISEELLKFTGINSYISNYLKFYDLISVLSSSIRKLHYLNDEYGKELSIYNMATQDILHFIEFTDLNMQKEIEYTETIKKIRGKRRTIKNEIEILTHFYSRLNKLLNTINKLHIKSSQSSCEKELMKYKQTFSTKVGREKFLNSL